MVHYHAGQAEADAKPPLPLQIGNNRRSLLKFPAFVAPLPRDSPRPHLFVRRSPLSGVTAQTTRADSNSYNCTQQQCQGR